MTQSPHGADVDDLGPRRHGGGAERHQARRAELAGLGVRRVIALLPTLGLDESLKVLDGYRPLVEWARALDSTRKNGR